MGTAAEVEGEQRTGIAWYILNPSVTKATVKATVRMQGILALAGESLAYPTLGVTTSGRGILGFTRVGEDLYPSQGYASIDDVAGVGPVHMAALVALRWNPIIRVFAERLRERGKPKMVIVGAAMRKLLHIVYGVLKSGNPFDPSYAVNVQGSA